MNTNQISIDMTATGSFVFTLAGMVAYKSLGELRDMLYDRPVRNAPRESLATGCAEPVVGKPTDEDMIRFAAGY